MKTLNLFLAVLCLLISNVLYCQEAIPMKGNPEMLKLKDLPSSKLLPFKSPVDFSTIYSSSSLEQSLWIKETFTKEGAHVILSINYEDKYDPRSLDMLVEYGKIYLQFMIESEIAMHENGYDDAIEKRFREEVHALLDDKRPDYSSFGDYEAFEKAMKEYQKQVQLLMDEKMRPINNIYAQVAENFKAEVKQILQQFEIPFQSEYLTGKSIYNIFNKPDSVMAAVGFTENDLEKLVSPAAKRLEVYLREQFEKSNPVLVNYLTEYYETYIESIEQLTLLIEKHGLPPLKIDDDVTIVDIYSAYAYEELESNEEELEYDSEYLDDVAENKEERDGRIMTMDDVKKDYKNDLITYFGARDYFSADFYYSMILATLEVSQGKGNRYSNKEKPTSLKIKFDLKNGTIISRETEIPDPNDFNAYYEIVMGRKLLYSLKYDKNKVVLNTNSADNPYELGTRHEFPMKAGLIDIYAFNTYIALSDIKPGFKRTFTLFDVLLLPEWLFGKQDPMPYYIIADVSFVEETQDADSSEPLYKLLVKTQGLTMNPFWLQYINYNELPFEGFHIYVTKSFPHQVVNIEYSPGKHLNTSSK
jgi:hypothetical protein